MNLARPCLILLLSLTLAECGSSPTRNINGNSGGESGELKWQRGVYVSGAFLPRGTGSTSASNGLQTCPFEITVSFRSKSTTFSSCRVPATATANISGTWIVTGLTDCRC